MENMSFFLSSFPFCAMSCFDIFVFFFQRRHCQLRHFPVSSTATGRRGGKRNPGWDKAPSHFGPKLDSKGGPEMDPLWKLLLSASWPPRRKSWSQRCPKKVPKGDSKRAQTELKLGIQRKTGKYDFDTSPNNACVWGFLLIR